MTDLATINPLATQMKRDVNRELYNVVAIKLDGVWVAQIWDKRAHKEVARVTSSMHWDLIKHQYRPVRVRGRR